MVGRLMENLAQIAAKVEGTEGTWEPPAAADAGFLVHEPSLSPVVDFFTNKPARKTYTPKPGITGARARTASFGVDLAGSGAVNTAPKWSFLLRAASMTEDLTPAKLTVGAIAGGPYLAGERVTDGTWIGIALRRVVDGTTTFWAKTISGAVPATGTLTGSTSGATSTISAEDEVSGVLWYPESDQDVAPTLSLAGYFAGVVEALRGGRSNVTFACTRGQPVRMNHEFSGVLQDSFDAALLSSITFDTTEPPAFIAVAMLINAVSIPFETLSFNMQNDVQPRPDANAADGYLSYHVGGREPQITMDPESVKKADLDYDGLLKAGTKFPVELVVGTVAGNKFLMSWPNCQFSDQGPGSRNLIRTKDVTIACVGVDADGEDEFFMLQF